MVKVARDEVIVCLLELTALFEGETENQNKVVHREIEKLLDKYREVFRMPKELSPVGTKKHAINLQPGIAPINLRPYRYLFTQKNEI